MKDATNDQRTAARGVMREFPALKLDLVRGDGQMTLTPYRIETEARGAPVTVIYGSTLESDIQRKLKQSCASLMAEV